MHDSLKTSITQLAALLAQANTLAVPYDAQIRALEIQKADALAALNWQIDHLKTVVKQEIMAYQATVKKDGVTASYIHKEIWDNDRLSALAVEIPAIRQALKDGSYVVIRYTAPLPIARFALLYLHIWAE